MFTAQDKIFILDLAQRSIVYCFETGNLLRLEEKDLPSKRLAARLSCFITLKINEQLRGCIGHIEPIQPLYLDVIENAASAAFDDPRFDPVNEQELNELNIEVSILSAPVPLDYTTTADLLKKIVPDEDGVIIKFGQHSATYLPQVWQELPDKEKFLSSLCLKAGLAESCWKENKVEVQRFHVEIVN